MRWPFIWALILLAMISLQEVAIQKMSKQIRELQFQVEQLRRPAILPAITPRRKSQI